MVTAAASGRAVACWSSLPYFRCPSIDDLLSTVYVDRDTPGIIAAAQVSVLAIVFTLSLFIVEQAAQKYGRRVQRRIQDDTWTRNLRASYVVATIYGILIQVFLSRRAELQIAAVVLIGSLTVWSSINLLLLGRYYRRIIDVTDPAWIAGDLVSELKATVAHGDHAKAAVLIDTTKELVEELLRQGRHLDAVGEVIRDLGDLAREMVRR